MTTARSSSAVAGSGLEQLLAETIEALSRLDARRIEVLAEIAERMAQEPGAGRIGRPESAAGWKRAAASHWVLGHLVGETARQLAVQRRIADRVIAGRSGELSDYRPGGDAWLAESMNTLLAWPWQGGMKRRGPDRGA